MTQGIGSQRWINYQQFIQTLEKLGDRTASPAVCNGPKVDTALNFWREKKQRLQAWRTLLGPAKIAAATRRKPPGSEKKWMK